jgi:hypothetical protein
LGRWFGRIDHAVEAALASKIACHCEEAALQPTSQSRDGYNAHQASIALPAYRDCGGRFAPSQ